MKKRIPINVIYMDNEPTDGPPEYDITVRINRDWATANITIDNLPF